VRIHTGRGMKLRSELFPAELIALDFRSGISSGGHGAERNKLRVAGIKLIALCALLRAYVIFVTEVDRELFPGGQGARAQLVHPRE